MSTGSPWQQFLPIKVDYNGLTETSAFMSKMNFKRLNTSPLFLGSIGLLQSDVNLIENTPEKDEEVYYISAANYCNLRYL